MIASHIHSMTFYSILMNENDDTNQRLVSYNNIVNWLVEGLTSL